MTSRKNQVLDRTLWPELLEAASRIPLSGAPYKDQPQLLTVALRDHTTEQEAGNKTRKLLTRVYINPPPEVLPFIQWALAHPEHFPDRRVLHLGSLLAAYPFVGSVASALGKAFSLGGEITGLDLRRRLVADWGARNMVELGAIKTAGTLRRFAVVDGGGTKPLRPGEVLSVSGTAASWLVHALTLTRQQQTIDAATVADAAELFWARLGPTDAAYPHLEIHREGGGRVVFEIKPSVPEGFHKE